MIITYCIAGPLFIISGIKYGNELKRQNMRIVEGITEAAEKVESRGSLNSKRAPAGNDTWKGENRM